MAADVVTPIVPARPVAAVGRTTRAMSCAASLLAVGSRGSEADLERLALRGVERLDDLERRWSRFIPTSEVSVLNDSGGMPVVVSDDTVRLVTALVQGWHLTDGSFDPTLLGALVGLGYAASRADAERRTSLAPTVAVRGRPDGVLVDHGHAVVQLPAGTALDPGGMGKGLAADLVVEELRTAGAIGALVEVGGDLRVSGRAPGSAWVISVDTAGPDGVVLVSLQDGGIATSTSRLRTWRADGERRHHLIDPATLRPSARDAVSCTVIAGSAATAEAFTKVAFAHDPHDALDRFEQRELAASITTTGGERLVTTSWRSFELETGAAR